MNCNNDFQTHKNVYEYYFNNYQSVKILSCGYNEIDNYKFAVDKNYYYVTSLTELYLFYEINLKTSKIKIRLYDCKNNIVEQFEISINCY